MKATLETSGEDENYTRNECERYTVLVGESKVNNFNVVILVKKKVFGL